MWKDVVGYEGFYMVNEEGEVKSLDREVWNGKVFYLKKGRILKNILCKNGYYCVVLSGTEGRRTELVHRLVAKAFIYNDDLERNCVDHMDGNKTNNSLCNLRWVTHKENCNNENTKVYGEGQSMYGKDFTEEHRKNMGKSRMKKVVCINDMTEYESLGSASVEKGICGTLISKCCNGKQCSAGKSSVNGEPLVWVFKSDFENMADEEIVSRIEKAKKSIENRLCNLKKFKHKAIEKLS